MIIKYLNLFFHLGTLLFESVIRKRDPLPLIQILQETQKLFFLNNIFCKLKQVNF